MEVVLIFSNLMAICGIIVLVVRLHHISAAKAEQPQPLPASAEPAPPPLTPAELFALAGPEIVSEVIHDIKTPLTVMGGYAKLTLRQLENNMVNEQTHENLQTIFSETQRLSTMVDKLINPKRTQYTEEINAVTLVAELMQRVYTMCSMLLEFNANKLEIEIEEDCPPVRINADKVIQIFFNLVGNANRYVNEDTIKIHVAHDDGLVAFSVWNNGPIIPADMINHLFNRGISGHGSTGLGLHICRETIERHGGTIGVVSASNTGTKFTFTLPSVANEIVYGEKGGLHESDHSAG